MQSLIKCKKKRVYNHKCDDISVIGDDGENAAYV